MADLARRLLVMGESGGDGHVFISAARDDSARADRLARVLDQADIPVWLAAAELRPGQERRAQVREAISGAIAFVACFFAGERKPRGESPERRADARSRPAATARLR